MSTLTQVGPIVKATAEPTDRAWWDAQTVDPTGLTFPALPPAERYSHAPPVQPEPEPEPADEDRAWWATAADEPDPDTFVDFDELYREAVEVEFPATLGIGHPASEDC